MFEPKCLSVNALMFEPKCLSVNALMFEPKRKCFILLSNWKI